MKIARMTDGTLKEIDIDVNDPKISDLEDVEEVYVISKVLVPQMKLVPKPKEEREAVKKENSTKSNPKSTQK